MASVSEVVQRKKLQLAKQMRSLQKQADTLKAMDEMGDTELQLELFDLLDLGNNGKVPLQEIISWVSVSEELLNSVTPAELEAAAGGTTFVDRTQFGHFLEALVTKAGGRFKDWAELLVLSHRPPATRRQSGTEPCTRPLAHMAPEGRPGHKQQGVAEEGGGGDDDVPESMLRAVSHDGRMRDLFALFDMDLDGKVGFKDVAVGLHKIAPHVPLEEASEAALKVLLSYDRDHDRSLSYSEFVHFICAFLHAGGLSFSQVAGALVFAAARPDPSEDEQRRIDALAEVAPKDYPTFGDWRAHRIFDLLDRDQDGLISFKELVLGLHRFEPDAPLRRTAQEAASAFLEEAKQQGGVEGGVPEGLDRAQFVQLLDRFVQSSGASFDQVADYLVALATIGSGDGGGGQEGSDEEEEAGAKLPAWWFQKFLWDTPETAQADAEDEGDA